MEKINSAINWYFILNIAVILIIYRKNPKGDNFNIVYYYVYLLYIIQLGFNIIIGYIKITPKSKDIKKNWEADNLKKYIKKIKMPNNCLNFNY